jgi:DNA-binding YbaB/EbfC family protein|tara:strand:- start:101 stop:406 length:306 start_codon:yes stop_codon:yes gene_type:complete
MNLSMVSKALELKSQLDKAQKELAKMTVEAQSGKGTVRVTASGQQKILSITISPEAIDPTRAGHLETLVLKAVSEALDQSRKLAAKHLEKLTGGIKIPGLT